MGQCILQSRYRWNASRRGSRVSKVKQIKQTTGSEETRNSPPFWTDKNSWCQSAWVSLSLAVGCSGTSKFGLQSIEADSSMSTSVSRDPPATQLSHTCSS